MEAYSSHYGWSAGNLLECYRTDRRIESANRGKVRCNLLRGSKKVGMLQNVKRDPNSIYVSDTIGWACLGLGETSL